MKVERYIWVVVAAATSAGMSCSDLWWIRLPIVAIGGACIFATGYMMGRTDEIKDKLNSV